jgi:DNA modification methylase
MSSDSDFVQALEPEHSLKNQLRANGRRRREELLHRAALPPLAPMLPNDPFPKLELAEIPLADLKRLSRKVRKIDPAHIREIAISMQASRLIMPPLINANNEVVNGESTIEAAKLLGLSSMQCLRADHLSRDQARVLRLAINRLGETGQWDLQELQQEFEELIREQAALEATGFSSDTIDFILIGDEAQAVEEGPLEPDASGEPISRRGDVFLLGAHRVICGDAKDVRDLARLLEGDPEVGVIFTDEPYNVPISGHVTGGNHAEFVEASGEMSEEEFLQFNAQWMETVLPFLRDGGIFGTFIDWRGYPTVHAAAISVGLKALNLIVWGKTNAGMGSHYRSQHELLPLFKKGEAAHVNNVQLGKRGRWRSNLWQYPGASSLGSDARRGLKDHPTVKPTAMLEDALLDITNRGDIVLDPFLGSGSTLMAAEKTGRICRGVELDPRYVDVIVRRYEKATKKAAVLAETGETFAALEARRASEAVAGTPSTNVG